jgi:L-alanine-DL-glutamate epimerase-like enolase superfamily enzyme
MQRNVIEEFYRELEATDEAYIRKRLLINGYSGWKIKHVKQFLDGKDAARAERRARWTTRWTMIGAVGAVGAALVAVIALWR